MRVTTGGMPGERAACAGTASPPHLGGKIRSFES